MSREWKPGAVAATDYQGVKSRAFVVEGEACPTTHPRSPHWHGQTGGWNPLDDGLVTYRPLVVIDPEDPEQVERLAEAWDDLGEQNFPLGQSPMAVRGYRMQAALREFAKPTPPKPEEPTGLGAVVEDAEGRRWVRAHGIYNPRGQQNGMCVWHHDEPLIGKRETYRTYDGIDAVRVLSEGVPSC